MSSRRHPSDHVAYVVSMYPAISHTFIERELQALEQLGTTVERFSIRPSPPDQVRSEHARSEASRTTVLRGSPPAVWAKAHVSLLRASPRAWLRGLAGAFVTGRPTPRAKLWQVFYFGQAVLLLHHARAGAARHFHVHFANNSADIARRAVAIGNRLDGPGRWSWSLGLHGPQEFEDPVGFDVAAKAQDAAFVACISEYCRRSLLELLPPGSRARLSIVRMGVDPGRFPSLVEGRAARPGPGTRVLFVGRLVDEKAPGLLLDALSTLDEPTRSRLQVAFVGDGPLRAELGAATARLGLGRQVRFVGAVGQDELLDWYGWADVFCLPSVAEGIPVVLMEAMSTELPVITTSVAGIPELVVDGETGLLAAPGDAAAIARAIARLADDPALRLELGRAGRRATLASYTPAQGAAALHHLLATTP